METPTLVGKREAGRPLGGVSEKTVDRLRAEGELAWLHVRGKVMVRVDSIADYIARQERKALECSQAPPRRVRPALRVMREREGAVRVACR